MASVEFVYVMNVHRDWCLAAANGDVDASQKLGDYVDELRKETRILKGVTKAKHIVEIAFAKKGDEMSAFKFRGFAASGSKFPC